MAGRQPTDDASSAAGDEPAALESVLIRNEFSSVLLTVRQFGQGTRLEVRSTLFGTVAMLDATVLEALSRLDQAALAELVGLGMTKWDEEHP